MINNEVYWCNNCVMPSTRPRLTFDEDRICSACQWSKFKKTNIVWENRWSQLLELLEKNKNALNVS